MFWRFIPLIIRDLVFFIKSLFYENNEVKYMVKF